MRKGYFSLDMVIGFVIFIMVFTTAIFYIGVILRPGSNADQLNNAGIEFAKIIPAIRFEFRSVIKDGVNFNLSKTTKSIMRAASTMAIIEIIIMSLGLSLIKR